jgi:diguanylate cyclase (GGDEF)-like protein
VFRTINRWLDALPWAGVWGLGLALTALAGAADLATDPQLSPVIFYLIPVGVEAWYGGRRAGFGFALLSGIVLYTADQLTGRPHSSAIVPLWNATTRLSVLLVTVALISGLRRALVYQRELASTDPLTGIANRRWFYRVAEVELERARRYGRPLTLAYIDLDNFKQLNDQLGHHAGDEALRAVANILRSNVRRTDLVSRFGGDEFTVLLPETDQPQARMVFEKLRPLLVAEVHQRGWGITCSIGVVTAVPPPPEVDILIRSADQLMYRAKRGSKDAVLFDLYRSEPVPSPR